MAKQETAIAAEDELMPMNVQRDQQNVLGQKEKETNVVRNQALKIRREKPETLFKWKLKENDGCCSSWCSAHLFLIYLLLENIANIAIAAYHIKVLTAPYDTYTICYPSGTGEGKDCTDEREFYEDNGLNIIYLGFEIAFLAIYFFVCILSFYALHKCKSWILFLLWLCINIQIAFILIHSILTGVFWGIVALLIPIMLSCYFWMVYQLAKYYEKGGIYDQDMSHLSPAPNNYAVLYIARPEDLAYYDKHYETRAKKSLDGKRIFRQRMTERFNFCCCPCTLQTWSIIWLIYMICQNLLWFASAVTTTVILYDPYETWNNCVVYGGNEPQNVDCRELFETQGFTKAFAIITCIISGVAVFINIWCFIALFRCDRYAFMAQVWWLMIQALFMLLFSIFTGYYFGLFAILVPMLLSCHFYNVYIVAAYSQQEINTKRIPRMKGILVDEQRQQYAYEDVPKERSVVYADNNHNNVQPVQHNKSDKVVEPNVVQINE